MLGLGLLLDKPTSAYHLTRSVLEHTDHLVGNHQLIPLKAVWSNLAACALSVKRQDLNYSCAI